MNREHFAWAAGFFDGEGCTITLSTTAAGCPIPGLTVVQAVDYDGSVAEVLHRFATAMDGLNGRVFKGSARRQPHHRHRHHFRVSGFEHTQAALARMWPWLSDAKKTQAIKVLRRYLDYWHSDYAKQVNQGRRTHCPHGHEYTPENTYLSKSNRRHCRTCAKRRWEARNALKREERRLARLATTDVRAEKNK